MIFMATKIQATPILRGKDAEKFIEYLKREPTKEEKEFAKRARITFSKVKFLG